MLNSYKTSVSTEKVSQYDGTHRILAVATGSSITLLLLKNISEVTRKGFTLYVPW